MRKCVRNTTIANGRASLGRCVRPILSTEVTMPADTRMTKSFSLDRSIFKEVERTKGAGSTSERVNTLLRAGLEAERRCSLHGEAAAHFRGEDADRATHDAFHQAGIDVLTRGRDD